LQKYPVRAVFAGHEHFFNYSQHGQITYIITGCSGAYPYTDRRHGGFYHYVVIKVTGRNFSLQVFEPGGKEVDLSEIETPEF
jgi:hypothetical protein